MTKKQLTELIKKMTLEEKIDQLLQLIGDFYSGKNEEITGPMEELGIEERFIHNAGSTLGISGAAKVIETQKEYIRNHRLGIPLLFMGDIIHGYRTIFPIPLAIGCSWDLNMAEKCAQIAGTEAAVSGIHIVFSPMVDLVRDPRWGRVMETTGEDPILNSRFSKAFVRGYQGDDLTKDKLRVAACVKHFAAYGAPVGGRDYNTVNMSERQLRESYLPAYKAALDAGVKLVMTAFNTVDGIPATGNKWLLKDLLRDEYGFDGVVISDWGAVGELIPHGVAEDKRQAALLSLKAGVDIEMMTTCYSHHLKELIEERLIEEKSIDEAVLRILKLKDELGLFDNPYRGANVDLEKQIVLSDEHRQYSKEAAKKSIVLLKNDDILPLQEKESVALIGPGVTSKDILGAWSWKGQQQEAISLLEGARQVGANIVVGREEFDYFKPSKTAIKEALELAGQADKVVLAIGETEWMSGEAASRSDIRLPEAQLMLFEQVQQINKNIIVTLYNGRPMDLRGIDKAKAIVAAWFPGTEGGVALAEILWGKYNPSARLSMSFPENIGQVPVYYNSDSTGRPQETTADLKYSSKYLDVSNEAKYPFGFGLSYSTYHYSNLELSSTTMSKTKSIIVSVTVENKSHIAGEETVQLYLRDKVGQVVRPIKELKDFKKIWLMPGEQTKVEFTIDEKMLRYIHSNNKSSSENGAFDIMVGANSRDFLLSSFALVD